QLGDPVAERLVLGTQLGAARTVRSDCLRQMLDPDLAAIGERDRRPQRLFELADVEWKRVPDKRTSRRLLDRDPSRLVRDAGEERAHQRADVLATSAQRR